MAIYPEKYKCRTCGADGDMDGTCQECANCWEVEKRLEDYLRSQKGRDFVETALKAIAAVQIDNKKPCRHCGHEFEKHTRQMVSFLQTYGCTAKGCDCDAAGPGPTYK